MCKSTLQKIFFKVSLNTLWTLNRLRNKEVGCLIKNESIALPCYCFIPSNQCVSTWK